MKYLTKAFSYLVLAIIFSFAAIVTTDRIYIIPICFSFFASQYYFTKADES